jgi:hypothetical protein
MDDRQALSFIARALSPSRDPILQDDLEQAIARRRIGWERVVGLASEHLVTPALHRRLGARNLLPSLDDDLLSYLETVAELNRARNRAAGVQLAEIARSLNAIGVQPVLLKGAALLLGGIYCDPADRVLGDLDLLVRRESHAAALRCLAELGYLPFSDPRAYHHHHHCVPLAKAGRPLGIELHGDVVPAAYQRRFPTGPAFARSSTLLWQGSTLLLPAAEDLFIHNAIHHQLADRNLWAARFSLRQALDLVQLAGRFPERIGAPALAARLRREAGLLCLGFYVPAAFSAFALPSPLPLPAAPSWQARADRCRVGLFKLYAERGPEPLRAAVGLLAHAGCGIRSVAHAAGRRRLARVLHTFGRRAAKTYQGKRAE